MKTMQIEKDFTSIGRKASFAFDLPETDEEMLSDEGWGNGPTCGHARANVMVYLRARFESMVKANIRNATGTTNKNADAAFYRGVDGDIWDVAAADAAETMLSVAISTPKRERLTETEKLDRMTSKMSDDAMQAMIDREIAKRGLKIKASK